MSTLADSLNLRPQEKRVIVVIAVVLFVILNVVLVFPRFKEYSIIQAQLKNTLGAIATNNAVIAKDNDPTTNGWRMQLAALEAQQGGMGAPKEIQLQQTVTALARASGVPPPETMSPVSQTVIGPGSQSEKFFESQSIRITVHSAEDALVRFLWDMGNDPSMIRVRELDLRPLDNNRYRLNAVITLTADYQKTGQAKPVLTATDAKAKPAAQPPTPAPAKAGVRAASLTNVTQPPARRGPATNPVPPAPGRAVPPPFPVPPMPGRAVTPPTPGQAATPPTAGRPITPPTPGRAVTPPAPASPAPGQSNMPAVPVRPPRTPAGG